MDRAEGITRALADRVEAERAALLGDVQLALRVEPAVVELGEARTVMVTVRNDGPLRLRRVAFRSGESRWEVGQLAGGSEAASEVRVPATSAGDSRSPSSGPPSGSTAPTRRDGWRRPTTSAASRRSLADFEPFGSNPYVAGNATAA